MDGILSLLKSRKFWLSLAGVAAAVGIIPEDQSQQLAESITYIVVILVAAIAGEDIAAKVGGKPDA